ncbi:MAG: hypothetical protein IKR83_06375 [Bacteroidales bacterium]|nr:hypothetical protein [Bacteroidales bacterium]
MKKVLFTAIAAMAMFAMVACNNNKPAETQDSAACDTTVCEKACDKTQCTGECCQCGEECKAAKCEGCEKCGTPECCGENAGKCCKMEGAVEGQACEQACQKAEGEKCCKAEGKECEKKCEK